MRRASEIVREARRLRGLSQAELAGLAGTRQPAIARLEAGGRSPTIRSLEKLLAAMDLELRVEIREKDFGIDRSLVAQALRVAPEERVRRMAQAARSIQRMRPTPARMRPTATRAEGR